jgi:fatty acid desaturase
MQFAPGISNLNAGESRRKEHLMVTTLTLLPIAAAGWAFLVWIFGGGLGLAILVFIVLKILGH